MLSFCWVYASVHRDDLNFLEVKILSAYWFLITIHFLELAQSCGGSRIFLLTWVMSGDKSLFLPITR